MFYKKYEHGRLACVISRLKKLFHFKNLNTNSHDASAFWEILKPVLIMYYITITVYF